jgi:hypothetical protein
MQYLVPAANLQAYLLLLLDAASSRESSHLYHLAAGKLQLPLIG